ncbi:MAG: PAS domain S-box protein [Desulfomonilaceae bacterium]
MTSDATVTPSAPSIASDELFAAQTMQLYEHADVAAFGVVGVAAFIAVMLWPLVAPLALVLWLLAVALLAAAWWLKGREFFQQTPAAADDMRIWARDFAGISALCGAAYGGSGLLALLAQSETHQLVWGIIVAGMASAAMATHRAAWYAYFAFMLPAMTAVCGIFLYLSGWSYGPLGGVACLYGLLLGAAGLLVHRSNNVSLKLRLAREDRLNHLKQAEARYQTLFKSSTDAIFVMRGDRFVECNPATLKMFGCSEEQIIGRTPFDFSPQRQPDGRDSREKALEMIEMALKGQNHLFEWQHSRLDGAVFDSEVSLAPFRIGNEKLLLATVRDVTPRKRALMALSASEKMLQGILSASPIGIMHTRGGRIQWANKAWEEMFGYRDAHEYLDMQTRFLCVSEDEYQQLHNALYACARTGPAERDADMIRKDGSVFRGAVRMNFLDPDDPTQGTISAITDISERERIEESLRESEEKYRVLIEKALEGVVVAQDGRLRFVNRTASDILGYEVEEVIDRPFTEFIHPEDAQMVLDRHRRRLAGENLASRYAFRIVRKDGAVRWVEIDSGVISWEERPAALFFMTDITDRRRMEEELRQSQEWYKSFVENSFDGIFVQKGAKIVFANSQLHRMLGYAPGELVGMDHWLVYHPDYQGLTRTRALARMRGEYVEPRYEVLLQRKDGSSFYGEISAKAIEVQGEPGVQVWVRDITQRRKAEDVQRRLATAIEQAAEAVVITDPEGIINYVNPAFERITQYTKEEAIGQTPRILKSGQHDEAFYRNLWDTITRGRPWIGSFINRKKDGSLYREDATISPVKSPSGAIVNYVAVKRDITRETELQQQLLQAQKMEAVGTLAGGVAHDFNNLLQVVFGYTQMLMSKKPKDSADWQSLSKIASAAKRGAELVKGLLAFSRRTPTSPRLLNLNVIVQETKTLLERTIPRMIRIDLNLEPDAPMIFADPSQVEQILMNLALNARDAIDESGILTIESGAAELDDEFCQEHLGAKPGRYAVLTVSDTGHGMDKETLDHIFEPFYTTKEVGKGTGLGLAMVYGIVKQHEGYITCESTPGVGTTFRVFFPVADSAQEEKPVVERQTSAVGGTETILVVDDEDPVRNIMTDLLTQAGYKVLTASSGKEALEVYQSRQKEIALVLLDLIMPEMGGRECGRKLLSVDPHVKIVVCSGYTSEARARGYTVPGAKAFIEKPYEPVALLDLIRKVLDSPEG